MKPITLEQLETKSNEFSDLIEKFKSQVKTQYVFPQTEIELAHGEHYAGVILGKDGEPSYHLVLLPDEKDSIKWQDAMDWAKSIGAELPTRREQSLLFANLKDQFQEAWYWSTETHASNGGYAWGQNVGNGSQVNWLKGDDDRARAVRRLVIE